jgi:hypothetical protein
MPRRLSQDRETQVLQYRGLSSSTTVNLVPVQPVVTLGNVSTIHNNPQFWSYNIPPPAVKPTTMLTTLTSAFYPGIPTEGANMQIIKAFQDRLPGPVKTGIFGGWGLRLCSLVE